VSLLHVHGRSGGASRPERRGQDNRLLYGSGFHPATAGSVALDEQDINGLPCSLRARLGIAYLPQEPSIFRRLSVENNVRAVLETRADITERRKRERLEELLAEFGIEPCAGQMA